MATRTSLFPPLLCSIFILVAQRATAQTICFNEKGNFTLNSTYHDNLNHVLSNLLNSQNHNGYGFYNISYGSASNQVFAIGACQGDVTIEVCRSCLNETMHIVREACPNQKEVIQWADKCMLRYSNRSLFGLMETGPNRILYQTANVPSDSVVAYFDVLMNLTNNLKSRAAAGGSLRKFAAARVQSPILFKTIYGLVMCTPDLSQNDCINCLDSVVGAFPGSSYRTFGGVILVPSCKFRYEDYIFYNPTAEEAPPPSPLPTPPTASPPPPLMLQPGTKNNTSSARTIVIIVVASTAFVGLIISIVIIMFFFQVNHRLNEPDAEETASVESLQYSYETIKLATDNFSEENKLGQGGFGAVYKGRLFNGQDIAVKKLSRRSSQGDLEFKNEVMLVAKLQHRNLVRLLGFSLEGSEKLLVYEFAQNGSLDSFIFDSSKRKNLDWDRRYKIIGGVARGLLYLHEDSRLRIIHRDLKASNILLDENMHPKIADFGTARLFVIDQTQDNTRQIVGTYGYMAPEYVRHGHFSIKSDIFSFGVLLLEIISGQKINCFREGEHTEDLLSYTWREWREGNATNIVDPLMRIGIGSEIIRCIHIGLLCVQDNLVDRPTMNAIILMLNSNSVSLPLPSKPAFFMHSSMGSSMPSPSDFNSRMNQPKSESVNEASITEPSPR